MIKLPTSFHQDFPFIDVISREVIFTNELLVAEERDQTSAHTKEGCQAHHYDQHRVVDVKIIRQPGNKVSVACSLQYGRSTIGG